MFIKTLYILFFLLEHLMGHIQKNSIKLTFVSIFMILLSTYTCNASQFIKKEHIVIDLLSGIEWLRCSTGQTWDGSNCSGEIVRLNLIEMKEAIKQANEQLKGIWRLPTRKELEGIVCSSCPDTKINNEVFPSTPAEPFWTSDKNYWSEKRYWTVNFFTGYSFSRFTERKPLASRLVKDR